MRDFAISNTLGAALSDLCGHNLLSWPRSENQANKTKKETLFETWDAIKRNLGNFLVYEIPSAFDLCLEAGPSWQRRTLQQFFEKFLALA